MVSASTLLKITLISTIIKVTLDATKLATGDEIIGAASGAAGIARDILDILASIR